MAPDRRHSLLLVTFLGTFSLVLMERGLYFYTEQRLAFGAMANLLLALGYGLAYLGGAFASHMIARWISERRVALGCAGGLVAVHLLMALQPQSGLMLAGGFLLIALSSGLFWPVLESYLAAGLTPRQTLKALGRFNIAWASAMPIGLALSGWLISSMWPWTLFAIAALFNAGVLVILWQLPARPIHTPDDHPLRPPPAQLARYRSLLYASRWALLGGTALLLMVAPMMPVIFSDLRLSVTQATIAASLLDAVRLLAFVILGWAGFWYSRATPLLVTLLAMPIGFFMILFGASLWVVLLGELIFGMTLGMAFYAALYYGMVVRNAAVDAGGMHEGLVGVGFVLGPLLGVMSLSLADALDHHVLGIVLGVSPLIVLCTLAGIWPLWQLRRIQGATCAFNGSPPTGTPCL